MRYKIKNDKSSIRDLQKKATVTEDEQQLTSTYSDSAVSFLFKDKKYSYNNNHHHKNTFQTLDLPHGLIELLIDNNFTLESLINTDPSELSCILAIDQQVAAIICTAANKIRLRNDNVHFSKLDRIGRDYEDK